jgi:hypothetical protein
MSMEKAAAMRQRRRGGASYAQIVTEFGVTHSLAGQVLTNRCWSDPSLPIPPRPVLSPPPSAIGGTCR